MGMICNKTSSVSTANHSEPQGGAKPDSPGVVVFPPVLYIGTFFLGVTLHFLWPMHLSSSIWVRVAGAVLALSSGLTARWAARTMKRAGTNILPNKPTVTIVTEGPFRFSRNPLYVTNALFYLGLTLIFNLVWPLVLFVPMVIVIHWGIIRREERYLEMKFGDAYLAYKARVRRWL